MKLLLKCHATSILTVLFLSFATRGGAQSPAPEPGFEGFENLGIANIVFEPAQQALEGQELFELLPLKRSQPYHAADVRTAIERLYATGRYQDIQVDVNRVGSDGVSIRFITKGSWFIGRVTAKTDIAEPPTANQIVNVSRFRMGEPFDPAQLPPAIENIRKLLVDNGYFNPRIEPVQTYAEAYQQVNITFNIRTGKRARYTAPEITGVLTPPVLTKEQILKASGWRHRFLPGYNGITANRTSNGIDRIRLRYQSANRVLATVVLNAIDPDEDGKRGTPRITVNPGPELEIKTPGVNVSRKQLRASVPVYEEHAVDADLLAEGAYGLRDYFQSQGYFDATVAVPEQRAITVETVHGPTTEINYVIDRGILHRFVLLGIVGNKYFTEGTIRERMVVAPRSFEFRRGRYSDVLRKRDIDAIETLYQSNGFRDVKVTTRVEDHYLGRASDIAVFFSIEEGPQYIVSSLEVKGASKFDLTRTLASLGSQAKQPFSEFSVATDRETILEQYGQHGFPRATFEWNFKPGPGPHTVDLEFTINEGAQQFVREVVITGLRSTRPSLVNRQIGLNPGDPLSPTAMAETEKRLDDLGIFAQVGMAVQNPDGEEDRKYVLYNVEEAHKYSLTVAPGAVFARIGGSNAVTDLSSPGGGTGFSPRISVNLTRLNVLGRAQSISFQGVISTFEKRALINYYVPKIFNLPKLDAVFSVLYDDAHDVRTFQSVRKEASAQVVQHISKSLTAFYRFSYRHVGVSDLKIDPLLLPQLAQSVRVGMVSFTLVQDRRDDPIDPHKGIYNTLETGIAARALTSQTSFVRVLGRNATYYRLGRRMVFARETQFGFQPAFAVPANSDPTDAIPLPERFFGGGGSSLRAFPENQAGPRDVLTGFPLGGSALLYNNVELRFPLYGANVSGVLFEDAGNIFSRLGAVTFRPNQHSASDFDYMVHAVGFGIRYRTPVGPLRVDFAYSINPPRFNGFPGSYTQLVQCSVAGSCQASPQQISHFQFFFSIGQAF
jgi:outer membrane protein assembly complex protein YaeT